MANLGVVGVGPEVVGGGGSTAEQRRRRFASKSGELEPARRGLAAPLEVEEGMQMLIPGNAGMEGARRRGAERRRRWRRRRSRERRRRYTREPRWGLYRPTALAGKEVRPGGVRDQGWRGRPARWRRWTTGRAACHPFAASGSRVRVRNGQRACLVACAEARRGVAARKQGTGAFLQFLIFLGISL